MALNPNIILSGQPVNALGAMQAGTQAAAAQNQVMRENALADAYRQHGAGILAGDKGALNALAGLDPMAAIDVQGARLGQDATRQQMQVQQEQLRLAKAAGERAAQQFSQQADAQQLAQSRDTLSRGLAAATQARTPEQWDQIATQFGANDLVGQFQNRDAWIGYLSGLDETMARMAPAAPVDEYGRYAAEEQAAGRTPLSRIDYAQAKKGQEVIFDPSTGQPIVARGPAGMDVKFTETQSKDNVFATRMKGSLEVLDGEMDGGGYLSDTLTSRANRLAEMDPTGLSRELQSEDFQVARQAGTEFILALLRKDTGAAVTPQEETTYGDVYLPRPGDGPAVLAAKRQARVRALAAVEAGMNPSQIAARDRAIINSARTEGDRAERPPQSDAQEAGSTRRRYNPETGEIE